MPKKEYIKVRPGELSYEDVTSHKSIRVIEADEYFDDTTKKTSQYGTEYDSGRAINALAIKSLRDKMLDMPNSEDWFASLKTMAVDKLFDELRQCDHIGGTSAVLLCIALINKVPNLKYIYGAEVHDSVFVEYNGYSPYGRPDEISTLIDKDVAIAVVHRESLSRLKDCKLKDKPSIDEVAEEAMKGTTEWRGGVIDTTLAKAECALYHAAMTDRIDEVPDIVIDEYTRNNTYADQLKALEGILSDSHRVQLVTGIPGCGKSHLITAIDHICLANHIERPLLISYTNKATLNLKERLPDYAFTPLKTKNVPTINSAYYRLANIDDSKCPLKNTMFVIVDEASMMSSSVLHKVMFIFEKCHKNCRLILVGDVNQLPPVCQYGTPFRHIVEYLKRTNQTDNLYEIEEFRRSNGKGIHDSFVKFCGAGDHEIVATEDVSLAEVNDIVIASSLVARMYEREEDPSRICCVCETNKQVDTVNIATVKALFDLATDDFVVVTKYGSTIVSVPMVEGVRIVADANIEPDKKHCNDKICKSEFATLKDIGPLKSTLVMDIGGREVRIDNDLVQKEFKVGYAATVHKYQGSEKEEVIYILENSANMQGNAFYAQKELKYVGLSRATKKLDILALVEGTTGVHKSSSMRVHVNPTKPARMMF